MPLSNRVYSGPRSRKFWSRVNRITGKRGRLAWRLAVLLQDVEGLALAAIEDAEKNRRKKCR